MALYDFSTPASMSAMGTDTAWPWLLEMTAATTAAHVPVASPPAPLLLLDAGPVPPAPDAGPLAPSPLEDEGPAAPLLDPEPPLPPEPSVSPSPAGSSSPQPTTIASPLPATPNMKSLRDHRLPIMPSS